jgi:aspartyl protease family protein
MLGWALRCLGATIVIAGVFVGVQNGGLFEGALPMMQRAEAPAAAAVERPSSGGYLEETIPAGPTGHFMTDVQINGEPITFMIDTGATHTILNQADASRLGFGRGRLRYDVPFNTANGVVYAARVTLRDVRLGHFQLYDLDAFVNESDLNVSLLGMSFLRRFESYEFLKDKLVLRW